MANTVSRIESVRRLNYKNAALNYFREAFPMSTLWNQVWHHDRNTCHSLLPFSNCYLANPECSTGQRESHLGSLGYTRNDLGLRESNSSYKAD